MKYRVLIEQECSDCDGRGYSMASIDTTPGDQPQIRCNCSLCDGEGYELVYLSMQDFKDLLNEKE